MLQTYWPEFTTLALIHFLAVIAPGPDFAVTIRQSVRLGRQAGIATAIGIGAGISVHVIYTLMGVGALLHTTPWLMSMAEVLGGAYLLYIGWGFLRQAHTPIEVSLTDSDNNKHATVSVRQSLMLGFMTNATNPKATLFFLAVFTSIVSASTPLSTQMLYGVWMCLVNAGWFIVVSLIFTNPRVRQRFVRMGTWFERITGVLLLGFSLRLLVHAGQRLLT
ncbi:MAG: LysE family translocator [Alcaligenes aquatilis]